MNNTVFNGIAAQQNTTNRLTLRSIVIPFVEFGGQNQTLTANIDTPLTFVEVMRESGNSANYQWPLKSGGGMGTLYYEYIQLTQSGYYNFYYSFVLSGNATVRVTLYIRNAIAGAVIEYDEITVTTLGGAQQFGTFQRYIEANQYISIALRSTTTVGLWIGNQRQSPTLIITQIAQFTDTTVGKHSRAFRNAAYSIATATSSNFIYDTVRPAGNNPSNIEANQGGGNQLELILSAATSNTMLIKKTSTYLITASVEWATGNANGIRGIGIYNLTTATVLATQNVDASTTAPAQTRKCNVSTIASLAAGTQMQIYLYQNSNVTLTTVANGLNNFSIMDLGSDD